MHYKRWRKHGDPMVTVYVRAGLTECTIEGCDEPHVARTWCARHYASWRRSGDPLKVHRIFGDDERRFWSKVSKDGPIPDYAPHLGPCWIWTGSTDSHGYGHFNIGGRFPMAYRVAYEFIVGPIPDGLQLDHLCRVPLCVNPAHLEPVTQAVNRQRGVEAMLATRGNTCVNGHERTPENLYISPTTGYWFCRPCGRDAQQRYNRRLKERA